MHWRLGSHTSQQNLINSSWNIAAYIEVCQRTQKHVIKALALCLINYHATKTYGEVEV
jgi:hypothetical protein